MGIILPALLHNRRARLTLLDRRTLKITGHRSGSCGRRRRGRGIGERLNLAAVAIQVLVDAIHLVEKIGRGFAKAVHGGGTGLQHQAALVVVDKKGRPILICGRVHLNRQHDLAVAVGVDDLLIAVGQGFHGLDRPAVETDGILALRVGIGIGSHGPAAGRTGLALDFVLGRPVMDGVVFQVVVGIGSDLGVGGGEGIDHFRHQFGKRRAGKCVLQGVLVAGSAEVGIGGSPVAVVVLVQHVIIAVEDGGGHQVAGVAVGLGAVVIGILDLLKGGPGTAVDVLPQGHTRQVPGVDPAGQVGVQIRLDGGVAAAGCALLDFLDLAVAGMAGDPGHIAVDVREAFDLTADWRPAKRRKNCRNKSGRRWNRSRCKGRWCYRKSDCLGRRSVPDSCR